MVRHRLTERVVAAHNSSSSIVLIKGIIDIIDQEGVQYMHHAERKYLRIKSGRITFSPDSSICIWRWQVYLYILCYHARKIRNWINLKWSARRCGIGGPLQLSLKDLRDHLQVAHKKCKYLRKCVHSYRRKHMNNRLPISQQRKDEESEKKILAIIQREKDRSERRLKNMQWKNLWVEAQGHFKYPQNMVALLTSQDKIRRKTPFGIK